MRKNKGFSLIELLIVVAIILIIAAIAVPNLLKSKQTAQEASAAQAVRMLITAEITYANKHPDKGYMGLAELGPTAGDGIIDLALETGSKSGYTFTAVGGDPDKSGANQSFFVEGHPTVAVTPPLRSFCGTEESVVKYDPTGAAMDRPTCLLPATAVLK
jgi:prepilin-type N-terminal cleavage/methylation domain-containing protein